MKGELILKKRVFICLEVEKGCFLWWCFCLYIIDIVYRKLCFNIVTIMCIYSFKMCLDYVLYIVWFRFIKFYK